MKRAAWLSLLLAGVAAGVWWLRRLMQPRALPPAVSMSVESWTESTAPPITQASPPPVEAAAPDKAREAVAPRKNQAWRWALMLGAVLFTALLLLALPPVLRLPLFLLLVALALALAFADIRALWRSFLAARRATPRPTAWDALPPVSRRQALLEVTALALAALILSPYTLPQPGTRLNGTESEWITGSVHVAYLGLREHGRIPLWNPYYRQGEPLVANAVSFILNPFSSLPGLLLGAPAGVQVGVSVNAALAAVGGWFLARVLGLGMLARLLLGLLLLGKGNMVANVVMGYYQLGVQQAYFPWITAGALMALRGRGRWPLVMTGLSVALLFMAGNVWHILPMLISLAALTLTHLPVRSWALFNWRGLARLLAAGGFTLALGAVYIGPVLLEMDHIGAHGDEYEAGWVVVDPTRVPQLFVDWSPQRASHGLAIYVPQRAAITHSEIHFHYSYVVPMGLLLLLFVILPPVFPTTQRAAQAGHWRVWVAGIFMIALMTMWGAGGTDLFKALYRESELLRGWRFVGRALGMASFWIAVLVALRVDGLWRALAAADWRRFSARFGLWLQWAALAGLAFVVALSGLDVAGNWRRLARTERLDEKIAACLDALRALEPEREISLHIVGYRTMVTFIEHDVRAYSIESEFMPLPDPNTLGRPELMLWRLVMPEYASYFRENDLRWLESLGMQPLLGEPLEQDIGEACVYRRDGAIPYAFGVPLRALTNAATWDDLQPLVQPAQAYARGLDHVAAWLPLSEEEQALIVRETAYPGWQAYLNGEPAPLEIVGGYIALRLPPGAGLAHVEWIYRPPLYLGLGVVTILSALLSCAWLLRLDARLLRRWSAR